MAQAARRRSRRTNDAATVMCMLAAVGKTNIIYQPAAKVAGGATMKEIEMQRIYSERRFALLLIIQL